MLSHNDKERQEFLQRLLLHALTFGITTTLIPIALELGAALLVDSGRVWLNLKSNWLFDTLIMAIFFLTGAFVGTVRFALYHVPGSHIGMKSWTREAMIGLVESSRDTSYKTGIDAVKATGVLARNPCAPLALFLQSLGLVEIVAKDVWPTSQAADSFLMSLAAHLRDGNDSFIGDWRSGANEPEARRLTELVQDVEKYRITSSPGSHPRPARHVRAAIALIRADLAEIPHFLVIKSHTWSCSGAWTPVMGGEESEDGHDLLNTVKREVQEEMKLRPDDIFDVLELATAHDKRISKRLGLYTEYDYVIFGVQLRQQSSAVQAFFVAHPSVKIDYDKAIRVHEFTWLSWTDLLAESHLRAEMPTVMEAIEKLHQDMVPQTFAARQFAESVWEPPLHTGR